MQPDPRGRLDGLVAARPGCDIRHEHQELLGSRTPRAVVLALSASLGAIGAFMPTHGRAAGTDRGAGAHPAAATSARRRRPAAAGGASWRAGRSGSTRASRCQPQSRGIGRRTGSRRRARNNAAGSLSTRRCDASFVAPRPSSPPWHRETLERVASATGPVLALLEKARAQLEADVALGLTFQGSYSQTKPKDPAYGGHASAMGPAPANVPSPEDGAPVPVTFEVGAQPAARRCIAAVRPRTTSSNRPAAASPCSTTTATGCSTSIW